MKRAIIESPFAGEVERNKEYLERLLRWAIQNGFTPYASHKMLTDCLDDLNPAERLLGISGAHAWREVADVTIVGMDYGISDGMAMGIGHANNIRQRVLNVYIGTNDAPRKTNWILEDAYEYERSSNRQEPGSA